MGIRTWFRTWLPPWLIYGPLSPWARRRLLRALGASIGRNTRIHPIHIVNADWGNLSIGDDCYIGAEIVIDLADRVVIGDRISIGQGTLIFTHQDPGQARVPLPVRHSPVTIESDSFIGVGSILLAGARVASGEIVPAGTVVKSYRQPQPVIPKR